MDETQSATPAAAQWYSLGPSRSVKRSLFSAGSSRRPVPVDREEVMSSDQSAASPNRQRYDWVRAGAPFNRSLSMRVKSSRHATKNCGNCSSESCHHTSPRTKGRKSSVGHSAAHEFEFHSFSTSSTMNGNAVMATGSGLNDDVLYGTPSTKRTRNQPAKSAPDRAAADRRLPPVRPSRESRRPAAPEMEFSAASADDRRCARLELAVEERDGELRDLRQTMESNERALLRSIDDERRRWSAERLLLQAELLSARRKRLPGTRRSAFRSPSADRAAPCDRVVVVEPSQRAPAGEATASVPSTADSVDKSRRSCAARAGNRDATTSPVTSLPVEIVGGRSRASSDTETGRRSSSPAKVDRPSVDDVADNLRHELELCRREFADERRRWADEKHVVVEYQLRLQTYCRRLADRNQLLEERLRTMSVEQGRSGGSSGYGSDSTALVVQFVDDSSLLTSTL